VISTRLQSETSSALFARQPLRRRIVLIMRHTIMSKQQRPESSYQFKLLYGDSSLLRWRSVCAEITSSSKQPPPPFRTQGCKEISSNLNLSSCCAEQSRSISPQFRNGSIA
jgi:hypothetical protein